MLLFFTECIDFMLLSLPVYLMASHLINRIWLEGELIARCVLTEIIGDEIRCFKAEKLEDDETANEIVVLGRDFR